MSQMSRSGIADLIAELQSAGLRVEAELETRQGGAGRLQLSDEVGNA